MKFSILIILITVCSCTSDLPESKVPSIVYNAVKTKFPSAINIDWEKKQSNYEAEFKINGIEYKVYVEPTGKLIFHQYKIKVEEFPAPVTAKISAEYGEYKIDDAAIIEKDNIVFYQAELERKGEKDLQLFFSSDGSLTNQFKNLN